MTENINFSKKRIVDYVFAFSIAVLATAFCFVVFGNSRITNDQVVMRDIVSGVYSGTPDGHTVYIMYPLGFILSFLYRICKSVAWYDGLMFLTYPISLFFLLLYGNRKFESILGIILFSISGVCLFVLPNLWFIPQNEYTVDAGVFGATALFCLLCCENESKVSRYIPTIVMLILALWLRRQIFYMLIPIIVIIVLWKLVFEKDKNILKPVFAIGILAVVSLFIDAIAYSSPEWQEFRAYNEARTDLVDFYGFPPYENISDILNSYGMTEDEYSVLTKNIGLCDEANTEVLVAIADASKEIREEMIRQYPEDQKINLIYNLKQEYQRIKGNAVGKLIIVLTAILCVFSLLNWIGKKRIGEMSCIVPVIHLIGYSAVFAVYFIFKGRYPERISLPLYLAVIMSIFALLLDRVETFFKESKSKILPYAFGFAAAILITAASFSGIGNQILNMSENASYRNDCIAKTAYVEKYCNENPSNVYLIDGSIANFRNDYLFKPISKTAPNSITLGYWTLQSPLFEKRKTNNGLSKLGGDLLTKDNVFFVIGKDSAVSWLAELGGNSISLVDEFDDGTHFFTVYKVKR